MKHKILRRMTYNTNYYFIKIKSCFHPFWLVGVDIMIIAAAALALGGILSICHSDAVKNMAVAVGTGIIASATLAVLTELATNYRRNAVRHLTLSDVWSFLARYEFEVETRCGQFDIKKSNREFERLLGLNPPEEENEDEPINKTRVGAVLDVIRKNMPQLQDVYDNHAPELTPSELTSLKTILTCYDYVVSEVYMVLAQNSDIVFGGSKEEQMQDLLERKFSKSVLSSVKEAQIELAMEIWKEELNSAARMIVEGGEWQLTQLGVKLSDEAKVIKAEIEEEIGQEKAEQEETGPKEIALNEVEIKEVEGEPISWGDGSEEEARDAEMEELLRQSMLEHAGDLISLHLREIDKEMKILERMVSREPGFRELRKHSYQAMREYPGRRKR